MCCQAAQVIAPTQLYAFASIPDFIIACGMLTYITPPQTMVSKRYQIQGQMVTRSQLNQSTTK